MVSRIRQVRRDSRGKLPDVRVFPDCELVFTELEAIEAELNRVFDRFGYQALTLFDWHCILSEEVGETARAINEEHFGAGDLRAVYRECIQVASVAVHMAAAIRESGLVAGKTS